LFGSIDQIDFDDDELWHSISPSPHFEQFMSFSRFKDFWIFLPAIFVDESKVQDNPWYQFSMTVDDFNEICRSRVVCLKWIVASKIMCAWRPRTALGGLPNISFVIHKPGPLGKIN
jgi:hypothetical protein